VGHLRYVPPAVPRRLAAGLARPTVSSRLPVVATVETTLAARITVSLDVRGRRVGTVTVDRPAGRWPIAVPGGRAGALNSVSVLAESAGQVAADRLGVVPGDRLPLSVPRRIANAGADDLRAIGGGDPVMTCRRIGPRRVDCAERNLGLCQSITAYRLRRDGVLTTRSYSVASDRCRFQVHPRWRGALNGQEVPVR
jgi:hypothetical protein